WMATGKRFPALPLAGLRRGADPVHTRPRFTDLPAAAGKLPRVAFRLPVEEDLRTRVPICRAAIRSPVLARLDRLSRHSRRLHAGPGQRLFREQPNGHLYPARLRNPQSSPLRRLWGALLGYQRQRRARADEMELPGPCAAFRRLSCPRGALRTRRRHAVTFRRHRLAALRARNRPSG